MSKIQLSDRFGYKKILQFTLPSIVMMIFTSIYGVVDGVFVSNFVGKTPFAAVNFVMPLLMILGSAGFMFGTGGSAVVAKTMGEGDPVRANRLFSMLVYVTIGTGIVVGGIFLMLLEPVLHLMGAQETMLADCMKYGRILLVSLPFLMLQYLFQSFFITAEQPKLGLAVTVIAGCTNMVLDALFMAVFPWGLEGAALATAISQVLAVVLSLIFFSSKKATVLRMGKPLWEGRTLGHMCANGSSELMSNISMSVVSMLYNIQLLKYAGEDGIAAYGVLMYVNMIFLAIFIGYSTGIAPVVSFHFGAAHRDELKSLLRKSATLIAIMSVCMFVLAELMGRPLAGIFVSYDDALMDLTAHAFAIYSFSFLFSGISIFGSSFFTALNDGLTSALISFLRSLVFQVVAVLVFPLIWEVDGIWFSIVAAELVSAVVTEVFLAVKRRKYGYA